MFVEARTAKHEEMPKAAVKKEGIASTARTNEIREGSKAEPESKLQAVNKKSWTAKHRESIETTKRGKDTASAVERNTKRGGSTEEPKNKPQALKPRTVKQDKTIEETVREGDTTNTARRNAKREWKAKPECKLQPKEEPEPVRQEVLTKSDNSATGKVTSTRNYRAKGLDKRNAAIREPRELLKACKKLFNKFSGNYQFSLNRLKSVLLEKGSLL